MASSFTVRRPTDETCSVLKLAHDYALRDNPERGQVFPQHIAEALVYLNLMPEFLITSDDLDDPDVHMVIPDRVIVLQVEDAENSEDTEPEPEPEPEPAPANELSDSPSETEETSSATASLEDTEETLPPSEENEQQA